MRGTGEGRERGKWQMCGRIELWLIYEVRLFEHTREQI